MARSMSQAFKKGRDAAEIFNKTGDILENPYEQTEQSTEFVEWEDGFDFTAKY